MASSSSMAPAKDHIERIRRERYYIGRDEKNPLAEDIHQAVNYLSEELYAKDVHFLMELIQNAEDNEYPAGVAPSLEFVITSRDITATGAAATLLVFNNERGFSPANIESVCRVGKSTKKGNRHRGYIGEKGIGFKSVFLISSQPYIFSNGYQIKFSEEPCPECNVGYIVPEWVEENPTLSDIKQVYGTSEALPTTTIVLPLKNEKVQAVKQQLSNMHPEVLLFLLKIRQLSVREDNDNPKLCTVSQISISSETDVQMRKTMNAESYTLHLTAEESGRGEEECSYYMWKQKFPVKSESREKKRMEVDEWVITLAFPWGKRLNRGMKMPGVYAFLPTEMVTNFPFIMQADFLLASSRETILLDRPWNKGILDCVPSAFINAFVSLVKATDSAPSFSLPCMFNFLPVNSSSIPQLESLRLKIKEKVVAEHIIPCESQSAQKIFSKPSEVGRLIPSFWDILIKAQKLGVDLKNLSSHEPYILSSSFDIAAYDEVLGFLGVVFVDSNWYGKCIESSNLIREVSEEVYLEILCFIANNWSGFFNSSTIWQIPLLKYADTIGGLSLWSIYRATQYSERLCIASADNCVSWLIDWNKEFGSSTNRFFVPRGTQEALAVHSKRGTIKDWLERSVKVEVLSVYDFGRLLLKTLSSNRRLVIAFSHFLYHSVLKNYLGQYAVREFCRSMPLVDNYGCVTAQRKEVLVPAKGSKWVGLMGSNPWRAENYVELAADYMSAGNYAGNYTSENRLLAFLADHIEASDVPNIRPPDAQFPTVSSPLTKENTFLLLEWIRNLRHRGVNIPHRFLQCVKNGSWLKTSIGYKPPPESFLSSSEWGSLLQMGAAPVDIPMINQGFYDHMLVGYKEELRLIGVRFEFWEASTYIGNHLMSMAANSTLTRKDVFSLLELIRFLRSKLLPPDHLIQSIKDGKWLKTAHGYRSPVGSILFCSKWTTASCISSLPFIDKGFYGEDILNYKTELELLGVIASFNHTHYQVLADNLKITNITADSTMLLLQCIRYVSSSEGLVRNLRNAKWVKTHFGYKSPAEAFLVDSEWECLLEVVDMEVPLIDQGFYGGKIKSYKDELKKAGVLVSFEEASKAIAHQFKFLISSSSLTKKNVLALLSCYRKLKEMRHRFPVDLTNCIHNEKWLHTSLGFRTPKDSILFHPEWESVLPITTLPIIDDSDSGYGQEIYEYKDELKALGTVVEFKEGAKFVITSICIPQDPLILTASNVLSLLKCIQSLKKGGMGSLPKEFMKSIDKKWLKTTMGYGFPDNCILFDSKWGSFLEREDAPFIDEAFYGLEVSSFREELKEIGVIVDVPNGCSLVAHHLKCHSDTTAISRIYKYLSALKWEPDNEASNWIWIPDGSDSGKWVSPGCCVLHDKDDLFGSKLHVLDKHYESKLHSFFSVVLKVRHGPTVEDYCTLWNDWETSLHQLTYTACSAFWVFVANHWNAQTEKVLTKKITMLPVSTGSEIVLASKEDVFIPDDLLLKHLYEEACQESIFIWYPPSRSPSTSRAKLNNIFTSIGVQTISQAVQKDASMSQDTVFRKLDMRESVIKDGLLRIVLGFLADSSFDICAEKRHQIVMNLLDLTVLETDEPITVSYSLLLSSGKCLSVKASKMFRWEKESCQLHIQKVDKLLGQTGNIKFATYLSEVISEGLLFNLFEKTDQIAALAELLKLGCLLDFDNLAVRFLLKTKNLQLFEEDEEFLSSALSSVKV